MSKEVYPPSVQPGHPRALPIPKGWRKVKYKHVLFEVKRPIKLDKSSIYNLITVKRSRGGIKLRETLAGTDIKTPTQFRVEAGDFIISNRQIVHGACGIVPDNLADSIISNEYTVLHATQDLDIRFFKYFTHTVYFQQTCFHSSIGVDVEKMVFKTDKWLEWEFNLPPLDEQKKIANILDVWDSSVGQLEKLLEIKELMKLGLLQGLLTERSRFKEFNNEEWRYMNIGEIAQETSIRNKFGEEIVVLSCTKHHGLVDSLEYFGRRVFSKDTSAYKVVSKGDFAYATNHIEEGSIGYQDKYDKALISPMYTVFTIKAKDQVHDHFLLALLKTDYYRQIFQSKMSASVDRRGSLRWDEFSKIKIPIPPLAEQIRIIDVLKVIDKEIENLNQQLAALKTQKSGLMQKLLTGELRVQVKTSEVTMTI